MTHELTVVLICGGVAAIAGVVLWLGLGSLKRQAKRILDLLHGWPPEGTMILPTDITDAQRAAELRMAGWTCGWMPRHDLWYAPHCHEPMSLHVAYQEFKRGHRCTPSIASRKRLNESGD